MPELPDLAVISKNLNKRFAGQKLAAFNVFNHQKLNAPASEFKSNLENQTLESVERNGKELLLTFSNKKRLGIHLMLKGKIRLLGEPNINHKIFELIFDTNNGFAVTDMTAWAKPILNPPKSSVPDALDDAFHTDYLKSVWARSKKANIKKILTDQHVVRGIGNAYVDEILWEAKVSPLSEGSKIPDEFIAKIVDATKEILAHAIREITSITPDLLAGEIRSFLNVHNPAKTKSPTGFPIKKVEMDGRGTYYTDEQVLFV